MASLTLHLLVTFLNLRNLSLNLHICAYIMFSVYLISLMCIVAAFLNPTTIILQCYKIVIGFILSLQSKMSELKIFHTWNKQILSSTVEKCAIAVADKYILICLTHRVFGPFLFCHISVFINHFLVVLKFSFINVWTIRDWQKRETKRVS